MRRFRILFDRIIFLYFIVGIVPLLIILSYFLHFSTNQFSERIKESLFLQSQNYTDTTNTEVDHLLNQVYAVAADDELASLVRQFDRGGNPYYTATQFRSHMSFIRSLNADISDFVYINANSDYMLSQKYPSIVTAALWTEHDLRSSIVSRIIASNSIQFFPARDELSNQTNISFYLGFPVSNNLKNTPTGALLIGINNNFFENMPTSLPNDDLNQTMHNLIVDEEERIIFCDDESFVNASLDDYIAAYGLSEKSYTLSTQKINLSPWWHFCYIPQTMQFNSLLAFQRNIYIMLIVLCALVFLLISSVVAGQNIRIRHIAQSIVQYSGAERDYKIQSYSGTILQEVVEEFNAMTIRVQDLVEQLTQKERAIADSLNRQRIAEIKTMEAQINPHFLYNTLNTISWAAIEKGEFEISDMICSIAHLLQYSIRNVDLPVYVSEEVEWLKDYMFLQEKRFVNLFHYTITVKDNLDDCMIYKLLLQPLLENSILHAFDGPAPENHISVMIEPLLLTNQLQITVVDNGHGIPDETLAHLQHCLTGGNPDLPTGHIGLLNTYNRMKAYYGEKAFISIVSGGTGTKIALTLPMIFNSNTEEDLK